MSVVSTSALARRFGGVTAVDSLDLDITGGVVGLLGPNGSGKTTLLRMLATVLSPSSGDVSIFGLDPVEEQRADRDPAAARLPASGARLLPRVLGLRSRRLRRGAEGDDRSLRSHRRGPPSADRGRPGRRHAQEDPGAVRWAAPSASRSPRRCSARPTCSCSTSRPPVSIRRSGCSCVRCCRNTVGSGTVLLSTHHTVEVAAFCQRVIVMLRVVCTSTGRRPSSPGWRRGRVWVDARPSSASKSAWITADGTVRAIGDPPPGAELVEPTIDDGYLLIANGWSDAMTSTLDSLAAPRPSPPLAGARRGRGPSQPEGAVGVARYRIGRMVRVQHAERRFRRWRLPPADGVVRRRGRGALRARSAGRRSRSHDRRSRGARSGRSMPTSAPSADCSVSGRPFWSPCCSRAWCSRSSSSRVACGSRTVPAGGNDTVFSFVEMLQPLVLFVLAVTAGVALGRASAHRTIVSVAGGLVIVAHSASSTGRGSGRPAAVGHADPDPADRGRPRCRLLPTDRSLDLDAVRSRPVRAALGTGDGPPSDGGVGTSSFSPAWPSRSPGSQFAAGVVGRGPRRARDHGCGGRRPEVIVTPAGLSGA